MREIPLELVPKDAITITTHRRIPIEIPSNNVFQTVTRRNRDFVVLVRRFLSARQPVTVTSKGALSKKIALYPVTSKGALSKEIVR